MYILSRDLSDVNSSYSPSVSSDDSESDSDFSGVESQEVNKKQEQAVKKVIRS